MAIAMLNMVTGMGVQLWRHEDQPAVNFPKVAYRIITPAVQVTWALGFNIVRIALSIWWFLNLGPQKWMLYYYKWFIVDDLEVPLFWETTITPISTEHRESSQQSTNNTHTCYLFWWVDYDSWWPRNQAVSALCQMILDPRNPGDFLWPLRELQSKQRSGFRCDVNFKLCWLELLKWERSPGS